jgi:hypothetical protein
MTATLPLMAALGILKLLQVKAEHLIEVVYVHS